jgi:hypothetical protein
MSSNATRFESLLEAVPDALVGMDQKGVIRFVNRQTELLFGYDRDDLIGRPVETLVPESLGIHLGVAEPPRFTADRGCAGGPSANSHGCQHGFSPGISWNQLDPPPRRIRVPIRSGQG